ALGAILPLTDSFNINLRIFAGFLFLFLLVGAIYGFIFSLSLGLRNFKAFKKEYLNQLKIRKRIIHLMTLLIFGFFDIVFVYLGILIFVFPYFFIYARSIDESCMVKKVSVNRLTEGDWLYKNVKLGKKTIKAKWDGLSKKDIQLIKRYKKQVLIKQGIPFVPVFLFSFLILIYLWFTGNLLGFDFFR
ncbi:MAG: hypothetical protein ACE5ES_00005, partial [Candidatus Nanoarchaeia archaeon]